MQSASRLWVRHDASLIMQCEMKVLLMFRSTRQPSILPVPSPSPVVIERKPKTPMPCHHERKNAGEIYKYACPLFLHAEANISRKSRKTIVDDSSSTKSYLLESWKLDVSEL